MSQLTPDAITDDALFTNQDELGVEPPTDIVDGEDVAANDDDSLVLTRTESFQPVDDALRNWRSESARRMAAHAEQVAERKAKRRKQVALAGGALAIVAALAFALGQGPSEDAPVADVVEAPLNDASITITAAEPVAEITPEPVVEAAPEPPVATVPEPVVEPVPEPVVETAPEPVVETAPEPVVETTPEPVVETAASGTFDPGIVDGTLNTWVLDDTAWIQLDFVGTEPLTLRWTDATGKTAISDVSCTNRIDAATGRCYVGRNGGTIDWGIDQGATPGDWTISACNAAGACAPIGSVTTPL